MLERAVESALQQEVTGELEVVVVDDASTDDTPAVLRGLAARDQRVRPVSLPSAAGAAAARNAGIEATTGSWIAFLDDDDEWLPHKLARQLRSLEDAEPSVGVSYCPYLLDWGNGRTQLGWVEDVSGPEPLRKLVRGVFIGTPGLLVRRSCLREVGGFDPALPRLQDWDLCMRLARVTRFSFLPEPLFLAHYTAGGVSRRDDRLAEACHRIREKARGWPELERSSWADLEYSLGHLLMVGGQRSAARRSFRNALLHAPLRPRRWLMSGLAHVAPPLYTFVSSAHGRLVGVRNRRRLRSSGGS